MIRWNQLGSVETIYEEECEFSSTSSPSLSPSSSSFPASLNSRVEAWSLKTGRETDILIHIQGTRFRLHKDRVVSQSTFLKRHLTETSDLTLSPPLNITADTFTAVAEFCYGFRVHMTPSNVAAIRTAAELLGMTADGGGGGESLSDVAETYFRRVVGINREYASMVLRSCLPLLPDAETTASLVSRCIEALVFSADESYGELCITRLNDVVGMHHEDFRTVVESMNRRFSNHDVLYKMVDLYLKENKLREEEKTGICNSIDCTKLSTETLVDCVQNPRMPLRLVVRAVLLEHLNTRHSIASAVQHHQVQFQIQSNTERQQRSTTSVVTLGDILQRDTAIRQTAQLRAALDSTSSRIQSLEKELRCMNKVLLDHHQAEEEEKIRNVLGSERSASFHYAPFENGRVEKDERGSVSFSSIKFDGRNRIMEPCEVGRSSFYADDGNGNGNGKSKMKKTFGHRLMTGLKNAFRVSNSASNN